MPGKPSAQRVERASAALEPEPDDEPDTGKDGPLPTLQLPVAAHHKLLMETLEGVAKGVLLTSSGVIIRNVMVFMPPGSAKSTYTSVVFPTWFMGWLPDARIILASYAANIARKQGRRARSIVRQKAYRAIMQTELRTDTSAAHEWGLVNGSEFMAGGILGGITGNRAHGVLIDDPVSGRQDADSDLVRKSTREAYDDDLTTRLIPYRPPGAAPGTPMLNGFVFLVQTRWNQDDLAGSILPSDWNGESGDISCRDGQVWRVICIPAEAGLDDPVGRKPGEMLWQDWFTPEHWARFRSNARTWSALYQQRPTPDSGDYFKTEWIVEHPARDIPKPSSMKFYLGSDYATKAGAGDWTVHVVIGVDAFGRLWLVDLWREQTTSDLWVEAFIDLVLKWKPNRAAEEAGQIMGSVGPFLARRMKKRKAHVWRTLFPTKGGKGEGAQAIRAMMASEGLHVDEAAPWLAILKAELAGFMGGGKNDDIVDALGKVGQLLDRMASGKEPVGLDETPKGLEYKADEQTGLTSSNMPLDKQINDFLKRQRAKRGE